MGVRHVFKTVLKIPTGHKLLTCLFNDMVPHFSVSLSKPRAVEVTCYELVKVMALTPVSTSSMYETVLGTVVFVFALVCVCV